MSERMVLKPGVKVRIGGHQCIIQQVLDLETVLGQDCQSGEVKRLKVSELAPVIPPAHAPQSIDDVELVKVPDAAWNIAKQRFSAIGPLLDLQRCTRAQAAICAQLAGVSTATLYRWLKRYQQNRQLSALLPWERPGGRGQSRLAPEVETIIQATIEEVYLSKQKPSVEHVGREVIRRCRNTGLPLPHVNTVRYRIGQLSDQVRLRRREGARMAAEKYAPLQGHFPGADWPLAVVQIDHTPVDLILVDDIHRRPVGRPWITLAIDVFSRMVAGFYVSFDPPSAMSVGLCLAHAILPKETWLAKHHVATSWPVWGVMSVVHADNAKEFHSRMLKKASENYHIELQWRPVAQPHYGGHIERLLGTFNRDIHTLPGTTFSNPTARGTYDSDKASALTLAEFERWLTIHIVEVYHQRLHSELGTTPIKRYEEGLFGTPAHPRSGLAGSSVGCVTASS
jgi:putative transposase